MEEIKSTVLKWNDIYHKIDMFNRKGNPFYTNVLEVIKNIKEFANNIKLNRDRFNLILNQYLSENRVEVWIRFWIENTNNPSFENEWKTLVNIDPKYDISYENSQVMKNRMESLRGISHCDDPAILAIHEGLQCEGNGWFCWHCDEMEGKWTDKLLKDLKLTNNIFLNPILLKEFIDYAKGNVVIPDSWVPPMDYICYSGPLYKDGWTTMQRMKEIVNDIYYWGSLYKIKTDNHCSIFISISSYINTIVPVLEIIVNKCDELLE